MAGPSQADPLPDSLSPASFPGRQPCLNPGFYGVGAAKLAPQLLGKYLYISGTRVVARILETEAYPESVGGVPDVVYALKFSTEMKALLRAKPAGEVVSWTHKSNTDLLITAGAANESGDVVLLRSCEPADAEAREVICLRRKIEPDSKAPVPTSPGLKTVTYDTRRDLMVGPRNIAEAFGEEWKGNPVLHQPGGIQLFGHAADELQPPTETIIRAFRSDGGRRAKDSQRQFESIDILNTMLRFGLVTGTGYRYIHDMKQGVWDVYFDS